MSKDIKAALEDVIGGLISAFENERKQDEKWKDLFKKVDGVEFSSLLREAAHQMETVALDVYGLIEDELAKVGKKPTKEIFNMLYALPYVENALTKEAKDKEGSVCCVDKAFFIMNKFINESSKELEQCLKIS